MKRVKAWAVVEGEAEMTDKDRADRLAARCESQRLKIAELESKLARNFEDYANAIKAQSERIRELEVALNDVIAAYDAYPDDCDEDNIAPDSVIWNWETYIARAREALK